MDSLIKYMKKEIPKRKDKKSIEAIEFLNIRSSEGIKTYDGIDVCGRRCIESIREMLEKLEGEDKRVDRISFVGYSLGGLVLRFVVGRLYDEGLFVGAIAKDTWKWQLEPVNFLCIATPHLGTLKRPVSVLTRIWNAMGPAVFVRTGRQISLSDTFMNGLPMLMVLSDPSGCFHKALRLFGDRLTLIANIQNDFTVRFTTAAIESTNPYTRFHSRSIDPEFPTVVTVLDGVDKQVEPWTMRRIQRVAFVALLMPFLLLFMTVGLTSASIYARRNKRVAETVFDSDEPSAEPQIDPRLLNGTTEQRQWMIDSLNQLPWRKIHTSIKDTNAHAAVMLRRSIVVDDHLIYLIHNVLEL